MGRYLFPPCTAMGCRYLEQMATCQSLNCLAAAFQEEAHHRLGSDGACFGRYSHYSSHLLRGSAETEIFKALVSLNQVKVGG